LVTLTGSGGVGKTRLAIQASHLALVEGTDAPENPLVLPPPASPPFPDGAWWVELGSLTSPSLLEGAIAGVLGIQEQSGQSSLSGLEQFLASRKLLLILDNCEHLIDACAQLVESLLLACPKLTVLCTSREPLGVEGETVLRVPSMAVPDPAAVEIEFSDPARLAESLPRYEALQLFIERARQQSGGLVALEMLSPQDVAVIAAICRRLDGIPLAIELAAARTRVLSLEQIAARLDDTFRLLTGGSRTALPRHQTLMAAIDWSYNLLSEPERRLFRRLAVFSGGWSLEEVEFIFRDDPFQAAAQASDYLDLLTQLVNKSLVIVQSLPSGLRYRFLETVRQYAREKLAGSGEAETCRKAHHDWFVNWVELGESRQRSGAFLEWMDHLEREFGNLRAALEWSIANGTGAETALRLGSALYRYWWARGNRQESHEWMRLGLTLEDPDPRYLRCRAQAHYILAWIGSERDSGELIVGEACEAVRLSRQMGEAGRLNLIESLAQVTVNRLIDERTPDALEPVNEAVELGRALGPQASWSLAMALWSRALAYQALGGETGIPSKKREAYMTASLEDARESWALFQITGDRWNAGPLILVGNVELSLKHTQQAEQYYLQSLAAFSEANDKGGVSAAASALLAYYMILGDLEKAAHYLILTVRSIYGQGNTYVTGFYLEALGNVAIIRMVLEPEKASLQALRQALSLLGCASTQVSINYTQPIMVQSFIENWIRNVKTYPSVPELKFDEEQVKSLTEFLGGMLEQLGPAGIDEAFSEGRQLAVREGLRLGESLLLSFGR
jgi:predicted ATPase